MQRMANLALIRLKILWEEPPVWEDQEPHLVLSLTTQEPKLISWLVSQDPWLEEPGNANKFGKPSVRLISERRES